MVAGRSSRFRPCMFGVTYRILMILTTLTVGYSEKINAQQNDDEEVYLRVNTDSSALKQDDTQLADSTSDDKISSEEITNEENCHIEGTCDPLDVTDALHVGTKPGENLGPIEQTEVSNIENDISNSKDTSKQTDSGEKIQDQEESQNINKNINSESKLSSAQNDSMDGNNSSVYQWIKFILDPIIEEFKDGIYPKLTEKVNTSEPDVPIANESTTVNIESSNETVAEVSNTTETESTSNVTETGKKVKFECTGRNVTDNVNATVKLITTAKLLQLLNFDKNDTDNVTDCLLVMFYAPWCHFCAKIAPHYNALARAFPQLDFVAVDTAQFSNLLARFGTVSVPNILVFHQSRAAVKFNQTDRTFENFVTFVTNSTGLEPNKTVNVTEIDYLGPVPSVPTNEPDYLLLISWIFVIFCSSYMFIKSNKGQQWINRVRVLWVLWQEHQHID